MEIKVRKGTKKDLEAVLKLVQELAIYENAPTEVTVTTESMLEDGFGIPSFFQFLVAEKVETKEVIGTAIYFYTYSTWKGRVLYLEDLVVKEAYRRQGIGQLLFDDLVKVAQQIGAKRLSWQVLDWNRPAIEFYKKMNTHFDGEWLNCKLTAEQIKNYPE